MAGWRTHKGHAIALAVDNRQSRQHVLRVIADDVVVVLKVSQHLLVVLFAVSKSKADFHPYPLWSPRFWHGMRVTDWFRLAAEHRARIHLLRWPMAVSVTAITCFNSVMGGAQSLLYGFGSALGFSLVLVLFAGMREKLVQLATPAPFAGVPIAFISAGLLSMAFMGFAGLVPN